MLLQWLALDIQSCDVMRVSPLTDEQNTVIHLYGDQI